MPRKRSAAGTPAVICLLVIISLLCAALVVPGPPASGAPGCAPVAIVPIRGSGETKLPDKNFTPAVSTSGWEGQVLRRLLDAFYRSAPDLADVPIVEVKGPAYPAIAVESPSALRREAINDFLPNSPLYRSASKGTAAALRAIGDFRHHDSRGCKSTRFVLVGYSQGAMVARETAGILPSLIDAVLLYGDPWQKPNALGVTGDGGGGTGILRAQYPGAHPDKYYERTEFSHFSLCHLHDTVCAVDGTGFVRATKGDFGPHTNYFANTAEASTEAVRLAQAVRRAGSSPDDTPAPAASRTDIAIAIDTTGSMGPYIANARSNATAIANRILSTRNGSKVSLVEYRDHGDAFVARTVVPATSNATAFQNGVDTLSAFGGGDFPEAVYSGIVESLRSFDPTPTGRRSILVIGDAPPHDPEPVTGYTADQIGEFLAGKKPIPGRASARTAVRATVAADASTTPIPTSLYTLSADASLTRGLSKLSTDSGGEVFDISQADRVSEAIQAAIDHAASAPTAALGISTPAFSGHPVALSAAASTGTGPLTFEFDVNGDGTFSAPAPGTTFSFVPERSGPREVRLRVTDSEGRTAQTVVRIDVLAPTAVPNVKKTGAGNGSLDFGSLDLGRIGNGSLGTGSSGS